MLTVHRAERSGSLATALAGVLASPLADPFSTEIISVPAKGVERWLSQQLSTVLGAGHGDGIAANIDFPSPTRLVDDAVAALDGRDAESDPWAPSRMLWIVLSVIDDNISEPWCSVLAKHLGWDGTEYSGFRAGRRWSTAAHVVDLYRAYAAQRPSMFVDWSAGDITDGAGSPLPADLTWQAHIWTRTRERIGSPSPSERLADACERLRSEPEVSSLPERVSLFGTTRLTTDQLDVIAALAEHRDVHIWLPHPSPSMWATMLDRTPVSRRADDTSALAVRSPLLSSSARDVRELQMRLLSRQIGDTYHAGEPSAPKTLLGWVQHDIAADLAPVLRTSPDTSVQVHSCHGPARQVEVLRECLLHAFEDDSTLQPRDVLVMCPDVETYAPLVRATFGQSAVDPVLGHPGHRLRVRLADRALRQTNPILAVTATLLGLADGRVTASQVLDLAAAGPVRTMFSFSDDDLERIREWTHAAGARWGIGMPQRDSYGLGDFEQNTFKTAIDRILLGVAADESDSEWLYRTLPLDDVDGNDIDLAGRFAELVDRLDVVLRDLQGPHEVSGWVRALRRALDLLVDVRPADAWQRAGAHRELSEATENAASGVLRLADIRAMLASRLAGRPTRANFRTGELTVCTMVPMRSVPHRVVVLLGLDDDVFPRGGGIDGDDLLSRDPCVGERDSRSEDRQLLLDAVMSASEKLLLFYTGADPVSGVTKPPAIPLSELLDVLTLTCGESIVRRHPLQPFDPRNFDAADPFSYDVDALAGARAAREPSVPVPTFLDGALPSRASEDVDLSDLAAFLVNPTKGFLRQRLGFRIPDSDDDVEDALNVELDGLEKWNIGDRMLDALLSGTDVSSFRAAEWRRGTLPPFNQGERQLEDIERGVTVLAGISREVHAGIPETVDVAIELGDGRRLTGTIGGIHGYTVASTSYSRLAPKHRLTAWIKVLALAAYAAPGPWEAVTTGRGPYSKPTWRSRLTAPEDSLTILEQLVHLRDRGMREPIPVAPTASATYASRRYGMEGPDDALIAADRDWAGRFGDCMDTSISYVYGSSAPLSVFTAREPEPDEAAWFGEPTRFGAMASRLWIPLLQNERQGPS